MAGVEEIVTALQGAAEALGQAVSATGAAEAATDDLARQMAALGVQDKAAEFAAARDAVEQARVHLTAGTDLLDEAVHRVRSAAG